MFRSVLMAGAAALLCFSVAGTAHATSVSGPTITSIYIQGESSPEPSVVSSIPSWNVTVFNVVENANGGFATGTLPATLTTGPVNGFPTGTNLDAISATTPVDTSDDQFTITLTFDNAATISALISNSSSNTAPIADPGPLSVIDDGELVTLFYGYWTPNDGDTGMVGGLGFSVSAVPEPASLLVMAAGLAGLAFTRRRARSNVIA